MGWDYGNNTVSGSNAGVNAKYPQGGSYSAGDGQVVNDSGTTAERDALGTNLKIGTQFFNTTTTKLQVWTGTAWQDQT